MATLLTAVPGSATTTGAGALEGTFTMADSPCFSASCAATLAGTAQLTLTGVGTNTMSGVPMPYAAEWGPALNNLSGSGAYGDACATDQPDTVPPLGGNAGGSLTVLGGVLTVAGTTFGNATLTAAFSMIRIGTAVHLVLYNITISDGATVAINLSNTIEGQSAIGYIWTSGPPTCGGAVSPSQTAALAGISLQAV